MLALRACTANASQGTDRVCDAGHQPSQHNQKLMQLSDLHLFHEVVTALEGALQRGVHPVLPCTAVCIVARAACRRCWLW